MGSSSIAGKHVVASGTNVGEYVQNTDFLSEPFRLYYRAKLSRLENAKCNWLEIVGKMGPRR
jgi:hypothetical protein